MLTSIPALAAITTAAFATPPVQVHRLPDHGLQPRIALQGDTVHLVYLTGEPSAADVKYAKFAPGEKDYAPAVEVNSQKGAAVATGTVRGPDITVEPTGRIHIIWNGSQQAQPRTKSPEEVQGAPLLYTHSDDGQHFSKERNVMTQSWSLDGGASIAADAKGHIAIAWHGADTTKPAGESTRGVFLAQSDDHGDKFTPELRFSAASDGACACCGLHTFYQDDKLGIIYRRALNGHERDECLMFGNPKEPTRTLLTPWPLSACPMTTADAFVVNDGVLLAWESQNQVYLGKWNGKLIDKVNPPGSAQRKHPRVAALATGEILLAWTVGTGWSKGGAIAWQVFDRNLAPIDGASGEAKDLPAWGTAAVFPRGSGFELLY